MYDSWDGASSAIDNGSLIHLALIVERRGVASVGWLPCPNREPSAVAGAGGGGKNVRAILPTGVAQTVVLGRPPLFVGPILRLVLLFSQAWSALKRPDVQIS